MSSRPEMTAFWIVGAALAATVVLVTARTYGWLALAGLPRPAFRRLHRVPLMVAGVGACLVIWSIAAYVRPTGFNRVPSPLATLVASWHLILSGELPVAALSSARRVLVGFVLAMMLGTCVGWILAVFMLPRTVLLPVNSFLRYIPPTSFVTLLIVYFGVGETFKYAVVFIGLFFFVIQMVVDSVEDVDRRYTELALTGGMSERGILRHVIIPATMPRVVDIGRINLSAAWTLIVVAETVGSDAGLGHLLSVSQRFNRIENLYAGILAFGVIGFLTDLALQVIGRKAFPWTRSL